jgi:hypothetical protein
MGKIYFNGEIFKARFDGNFAYIEHFDDDGEKIELKVTWHWIICERCRGEGKHVHDAYSVWTDEDRYEDPECFEDMLDGKYDVTCEACHGSGKVRAILVTEWDSPEYKEIYKKLENYIEDDRSYRAECAAERAMGC